MALKIFSCNVRGLGDKLKRMEIFNWLKMKKLSIYMLQETHIVEEVLLKWKTEWGHEIIASSFSKSSCGCVILFNDNFNFNLSKVFNDPHGRYVICDLVTEGRIITLANIYAPNNDNPVFF